MKMFIVVSCTLMIISCVQESKILEGPFLIIDGVTYDQESEQPVNGVVKLFWASGQPRAKEIYKDGKANGTWLTFHNNGELASRSTFDDGILNGEQSTYFTSGKLVKKGNFKNGVKEGYWFDISPVGTSVTHDGECVLNSGTGIYIGGLRVDDDGNPRRCF
jgi:hypothetical protein